MILIGKPAFAGTAGVWQEEEPGNVPYTRRISSASPGSRLTVTELPVGRVRSSVAVKCEPKSGLLPKCTDIGEVQAGENAVLIGAIVAGMVAGAAEVFSEVQPARIIIPITRTQQRGRKVVFTLQQLLRISTGSIIPNRTLVIVVFHRLL